MSCYPNRPPPFIAGNGVQGVETVTHGNLTGHARETLQRELDLHLRTARDLHLHTA